MVLYDETETNKGLAIRILKDIKGKTVKSFAFVEERMDDFLTIGFTDGTTIKICYDWIYGIESTKAHQKTGGENG